MLASVERKLANFINLDNLKDASAGSERRSGATRAPTVQMLSQSEKQFTDKLACEASRNVSHTGRGEFEYTTVAMDDLLSAEEKAQVSLLLSRGAVDAATTTSSAPSSYRGRSSLSLGSAAAALSSLASGGESRSAARKTAAESAACGHPSSQCGTETKQSGSGGYLGLLSKLVPKQQAQAEQQQHWRPGGAIERSLLDGRSSSGRRRVAIAAAAASALILFIVFCVRVRIAQGHLIIDISQNIT